jgi:hypothetical protein
MTNTTATQEQNTIPKASLRDSLTVISQVVLPTALKGLIIRRPKVVGTAERLDLDQRAVRRMQKIRDKYGTGPLLIHFPTGSRALILDPGHVHRVLDESPEPFATAETLKKEALAHFEPKLSLVSHGYKREDRRRFNEEVLEFGNPMHRLAEKFISVIREEAGHLLMEIERDKELDWDRFANTWFRVVRRVVLGDSARDDREMTKMLDELRSRANWSFLSPKDKELKESFHKRLKWYLDRAEEGSLAEMVARTHVTKITEPNHQVPQYLFAYDPGGINIFRTLALLASHPEQAARAREEMQGHNGLEGHEMPYVRACLLEGLRLWPTTPGVLRESTRETAWETGIMPEGTGIIIFAPFFHRDDTRLPFANRLAPEIWLEEQVAHEWPLIPFSAGPGECPGRDLVLMTSSTMLAELFGQRQFRLTSHDLGPDKPLPGTLNNYRLRFEVKG